MSYDLRKPVVTETGFDSAEALQLVSSLPPDAATPGRRRATPAFVDQFAAIVRSSPCDGSADYTDARYSLDRAAPDEDSSPTDALNATVDQFPGTAECLTATNLAELASGSHLLPAGTVVQVFALYTRGGTKLYLFNQPPPDGAAVQITGTAAGGGKYLGTILGGSSDAVTTGTLAMPEGMTGGGAALILNEEEDGQSGHRLQIPCYAVGRIVGSNDGTQIVMIRGALGSTTGGTALAGSGVSADGTTWSRATNGTPVNVVVQTRTYWDSTGGVLYGFARTFSFDARGVLAAISAESPVTIDVPTACE